jgi:DNA-directed RNA polymerase sigma subunit (sigma70/sigma32)
VSHIDIARLRAEIAERDRDRTHWDDCYLDAKHRDCAIVRLMDAIAERDARIAELTAGLSPDATNTSKELLVNSFTDACRERDRQIEARALVLLDRGLTPYRAMEQATKEIDQERAMAHWRRP